MESQRGRRRWPFLPLPVQRGKEAGEQHGNHTATITPLKYLKGTVVTSTRQSDKTGLIGKNLEPHEERQFGALRPNFQLLSAHKTTDETLFDGTHIIPVLERLRQKNWCVSILGYIVSSRQA